MEPSQAKVPAVGSRLAFGAALVVVAGVMPQVWVDPEANRVPATIAFLVNAGLNGVIGMVLPMAPACRRRLAGMILLSLAGALGLVLGLGLLDAAFAFLTHPGKDAAAYLLFFSAAADFAVAAMAVFSAYRLRGQGIRPAA